MTNGQTVLLASEDPGIEYCFWALPWRGVMFLTVHEGAASLRTKGRRCFLFLATGVIMWCGEREGM